MTEQQYRVIADRDKGDDPKPRQAAPGDRITYEVHANGVDRELVRIERPVPTEHCLSTVHHAAHEWGNHDNQPGTGYWCRGFDASDELPSLPTREQIAVDLIEKLRKTGGVPIDSIWARWRQLFREYDDAVLALLQTGAER